MPVVVDPDPTAIAALLTALPAGAHGIDSSERLQAWVAEHTEEYVVVLGPGLDLEDALAACEDLRVTRPTVSVVLVRDQRQAPIDAVLLTRAIKAGARDVVPRDDLGAVAAAVGRAHQLYVALRGPAGAPHQGRVITVFSPKGGVGKTTMAVNLALALADRGARQVCLVDLDLAFGDVAITLQLFPSHTVEHAIGSEETLDADLLGALLTRHQDAVMVLAAPSQPDVRERVTPALVTRMLATLRETFDFIVVDTAPAFDETTLAALDETDECVVVATLDVPTLKNVRLALETLEMLGIARGHRHLLLNRADDAVGLGPDKVEAILGLSVAAQVATSIDIAASTNAGTPIVSGKPDHPSSAAIRGLAVQLAGAPVPDPEVTRMSLADRLAAARAAAEDDATAGATPGATPGANLDATPDAAAAVVAATTPAEAHTEAAAEPAPEAALGRRKTQAGRQDRIEEIKGSVHAELLQQLGPQLYAAEMDQDDLDQLVRAVLAEVLGAQDRPLSHSDRARVTQEISDDILGYGPIEPFLRDGGVSEVMVNGAHSIWIERDGRLEPTAARFVDESHLRRVIDKIVSRIGRRVDESSPMVDARLPDGSRVNAVIPPLAIDGSALTIRKFATTPLTAEDLVGSGTFSAQARDFLAACVRGRLNVIVSGSTGAGKTTTLNVLSSFIPSDERIVTIEDAAELQLEQEHVVRLESRPANIEGRGGVDTRDLVRNALRMRPDRIVVGEVRDASALDMLQAMNTGHDGSICTVHSNGPRDTLARIETMVLMAGMDLPVRAIREQMASALDLIVHQTRFKDGTRRITHVTEVERMEGDVVTLQDIFVFDQSPGFDADGRSLGGLVATGLRPKLLDKLAGANVTVDPALFMAGRR